MRFINHTISQGDTMQSIAQYRLGDMKEWYNLASFNNLKYPYIVGSVEEKMKNPDHLVTVGDSLLVKMSDDQQSNMINELRQLPKYDQDEIYALALGKDIELSPKPRTLEDSHYDSEFLEIKDNDRGDLKTVSGVENVKQSLFVRLNTPKGSYLGHPSFGSNIQKYLGRKNTEENATALDLEIERTLKTDGRVEDVVNNGHKIEYNTYQSSFTVSTMSLEESFEFVVQTKRDGSIVLLDNFNYVNEEDRVSL